jgi:hypothetical protein
MRGDMDRDRRTRGRAFTPTRLLHRTRSTAVAVAVAGLGLVLCVAGAFASGSAQGPPAGPKSAPFTQCPTIGVDTSCRYLIDVTSTNPAVLPTVVQDAKQRFFDGEDDVTVGVQNDTGSPLASIRIGVPESGDHLFAFDGDGLCWSGTSPKPSECPFNPVTYDGPDTTLTAESPDAGTVFFNTPLQPGQYTYFALEAAPTEGIVAGEVDNVVATTLTNTETHETGDTLTAPTPVPVTDQATIKGPRAATATGTVEYLLYADANCQKVVENLGKKTVAGGTAQPSNASSHELHNNATYYWLAKYSGDAHNLANSSSCGGETMTFGTPALLPQPSITTVLSGGGHTGTHITVTEGTAVTDTALITPPAGQPVTGRVTYAAYVGASCSGKQVGGLGEGGITTGTGPATNPVTLEAGQYYFQAFYSGSAQLRSAATQCGDEVLTVLPRPGKKKTPGGSPPRSQGAQFSFVGPARVNGKSGQILVTVHVSGAGTATATGVVQQGATLARAQAARKKKCRRGAVNKHGRCIKNSPVVFGAASLTVPATGTYTLVISPGQRALSALKRGKKLNVTVTVTFHVRSDGSRTTHVEDVVVKLNKRRHKR